MRANSPPMHMMPASDSGTRARPDRMAPRAEAASAAARNENRPHLPKPSQFAAIHIRMPKPTSAPAATRAPVSNRPRRSLSGRASAPDGDTAVDIGNLQVRRTSGGGEGTQEFEAIACAIACPANRFGHRDRRMLLLPLEGGGVLGVLQFPWFRKDSRRIEASLRRDRRERSVAGKLRPVTSRR